MKALMIVAALTAALTCGLAGMSGITLAEDQKAAPSQEAVLAALAEAAKPGPEHKKLEALVGEWKYTGKFWLDPNQPPKELKGTIERKLILGGRFLEETYKGTGFDGKPGFEGRGLIGYDNAQKKFTSSWTCTACTGTCTGVGSSDNAGKEFTFQTEAFCPVQEKIVEGREVLRFESDDKTVADSYMTVDGKEVKMMELVAVRTK